MKKTPQKKADFSNKKAITDDEFCLITGYKRSYTAKLRMRGFPYSKPAGSRKIFYDREYVEQWMLSNPKSGRPKDTNKEARQAEAANYVSTHEL